VPFAPPPQATLIAEIGAGTTFEVALVRWRGGEHVARRLRRSLLGRPAGERAFERHLAVLERMIHPAVPGLCEVGRDLHGLFAIELRAPGMPLRELVAEHRRHRGPLPEAIVRRLGAAAFEALAELHELADEAGPIGFVHGDLGPDHLFVAPTREGLPVRFVDFGHASLRGMPGPENARGTLPFVAPELARGEIAPSPASDVFALAASFAFAVTGRDPCRMRGPARLVEIAERGLDLAALAAAPVAPALKDVLLAALGFDPDERLSDARTIAHRLRGT
jgi:eukaryotic-like serine/threonine-protein kinase